jgi:hypothetical protein
MVSARRAGPGRPRLARRPLLQAVLLLSPPAAGAAALQNLTLYHVNEFKYSSLGITDMNEGDAAGDLFFAIKARALPVECPGAYDCRDPELAASKLQVSNSLGC